MSASRRVIAIIDWQASSLLKENKLFFNKAIAGGKVVPREWRDGSVKYRSLTLSEDGSCELQSFSTAAVVRRLAGPIVSKKERKARNE